MKIGAFGGYILYLRDVSSNLKLLACLCSIGLWKRNCQRHVPVYELFMERAFKGLSAHLFYSMTYLIGGKREYRDGCFEFHVIRHASLAVTNLRLKYDLFVGRFLRIENP